MDKNQIQDDVEKEINKAVEEEINNDKLVVEEKEEYIGKEEVYQCTECETQVVVHEGDSTPTECPECGGSMQLVETGQYDKEDEASETDLGEPELEEVQDEVLDTDETGLSDDDVGNISDLDEIEEPLIEEEEELDELEETNFGDLEDLEEEAELPYEDFEEEEVEEEY